MSVEVAKSLVHGQGLITPHLHKKFLSPTLIKKLDLCHLPQKSK